MEIVIVIVVVIAAIAILKAIFPVLISLVRGLFVLAFGLGGIVFGWMVAAGMLRDSSLESPWPAIVVGGLIAAFGFWVAGKIAGKKSGDGTRHVRGTSPSPSGPVQQPCTSCGGTGRRACMQCGGAGARWGEGTCPQCGGSGTASCPACYGQGKTYS